MSGEFIMRYLYVLMIFMFFLTGCSKTGNINEQLSEPRRSTETYSEDLVIKETLFMPDEMPDDFQIRFEYGLNPEKTSGLDTKMNIIFKDLIEEDPAQADLNIKHDQLVQIYSELANIHVINYPNVFTPAYKDVSDGSEDGLELVMFITPSMKYTLYIQYEDVTYDLYWDNNNDSKAQDAITLKTCFRNIISIIENFESFQSLPEATGFYE